MEGWGEASKFMIVHLAHESKSLSVKKRFNSVIVNNKEIWRYEGEMRPKGFGFEGSP